MLDVNATWRYAPVEAWKGDAAALAILSFDVDADALLRPDEQRAELEKGLAALDTYGVKPIGYRAPMWLPWYQNWAVITITTTLTVVGIVVFLLLPKTGGRVGSAPEMGVRTGAVPTDRPAD